MRHLVIALTDAGIPSLHDLPVFKACHGGEAALALVGRKSLPNHLSRRGPFTHRGLVQPGGLDGLFSLDIDDCSLGKRILTIAYTLRKAGHVETIRIISARRASRRERQAYGPQD